MTLRQQVYFLYACGRLWSSNAQFASLPCSMAHDESREHMQAPSVLWLGRELCCMLAAQTTPWHDIAKTAVRCMQGGFSPSCSGCPFLCWRGDTPCCQPLHASSSGDRRTDSCTGRSRSGQDMQQAMKGLQLCIILAKRLEEIRVSALVYIVPKGAGQWHCKLNKSLYAVTALQ